MSQTNEIARVVLAHPGLDAAEIMDLAKGVESGTTCASALKWLTDKGTISRARIDGRFCYWPPGKAPATVGEPVREKGWPGVNIDRAHKAANKAEDALPSVDKIHKRGVNRAEAATSGDRSAGEVIPTGAALRPTSDQQRREAKHDRQALMVGRSRHSPFRDDLPRR